MPVVEYKHTISHMGKIEVPGYIVDRGYWGNPADKTYLGWVLPEADREYYVPDTLTELTKAECVTRALEIHAATPYTTQDDADPEAEATNMTNAEVTTMIEEWYDTIAANNS